MSATDHSVTAAPALSPPVPTSAAQPHALDSQAQRSAWLWLALAGLTGLSLLANVLLWGKLSGIQQHLAEGSVQSRNIAQEAKALAQTMAERAESNQAKLALLDARLQEMDALNRQVEGLLQQATRTQNSNLLTDLEASLRMAQQQAQFTRNAQPLLDALAQAQTRLAQAGEAAVLLKPAKSAVAEDLARLKTANYPDINAAVDQLDELVLDLDTLPLWVEPVAAHQAVPDHTQGNKPSPQPSADAQPAAWLASLQQAGAYLWQEIRSLVQIERMDNANPAALNAQEATLLREQLKLYVLGARTAVLSGRLPQAQQTLAQLQGRLPRYFQSHSRAYQRVDAQLAAVRAQLGAGSSLAPQAQTSIHAIALLNERLSALSLNATSVPDTGAAGGTLAPAQKGQAGR